MSLLDELPHTISIARTHYDQGEFGGEVPVEEDPYVIDEPAWVQPINATLLKEFATAGQRLTHSIYLLRDPGLRSSDAITITKGPYSTAHKISVNNFREDSVGAEILWLIVGEIYRQVPLLPGS